MTDPALVDALVQWLLEQGVRTLEVGESPNLYDNLYGERSVVEVANYAGMRGEYAIVDLTDDMVDHAYAYGSGPTGISRRWRDADVRIAFPKLRSHPVDFAHLCLGGLEGIAGRIESRRSGGCSVSRPGASLGVTCASASARFCTPPVTPPLLAGV